MDYPKTRAEAKATSATHYFTGNPCKRGHIALRKTKGACVECMKEDWAKDNARRAEKPKSEAAKASGRRYYERNKYKVAASANNQDAEKRREYKRRWKERNRDYLKADTNARRRRLRNASPPWLTKEHKAEMRAEYKKAGEWTKLTGTRFVVDHIVPLRGENACGLHVPWNLQVIHQTENAKKGNKLVQELVCV